MVRQITQNWASRIVGPMVVAAVLGLVAGGIALRDTVIRLDSEIVFLRDEAEKGGRFTAEQGAWLGHRIADMERVIEGHETRLNDHATLQEHGGAARQFVLLKSQVSKNMKVIHAHTSGTSGRLARLDEHDRRLDILESKNR